MARARSNSPSRTRRWRVSPCAYLVGLLHPAVVDELDLRRRGYRVEVVDPHLWCPFPDGSSLALWDDADRSAAAVAGLSPADVDGYRAYSALFDRMRRALRDGDRDVWVGEAPGRPELRELLAGDPEAIEVLFHASIADVVERHVRDERLRTALHGQGTHRHLCRPRDPGTAAIHLMHASGVLEGTPGAWGYVEGGMGRVSFALADAAIEAGAALAAGVPVAAIVPGEGVRLEGGEMIRAAVVVSNADPKRTLSLCEGAVPEAFRSRVDGLAVREPGLEDQLRAVPASRTFPRPRQACSPIGPWSPSPPESTPPRPPTRPAGRESRPRPGASCTSTPPTTPPWPRPGATP